MARSKVLWKYANVLGKYWLLKHCISSSGLFFSHSSFQVLLRELWHPLSNFLSTFWMSLALHSFFSLSRKTSDFQMFVPVLVFWYCWQNGKSASGGRQFFKLMIHRCFMYPLRISQLSCVPAERFLSLQLCIYWCDKDCSSPQIQFNFTCLNVDSGSCCQVEKTVLFVWSV